jgi:manganese-dependent ADP-ribose/CDP-alcohol diphosphatase
LVFLKASRHCPAEQEKNSPDGLEGPARRFVMFGGGLSERQLEWFEAQLRAARSEAQRCVVFCHQPVGRRLSKPAEP